MNKYYDIKKLIESKNKIFRFKLNFQLFGETEEEKQKREEREKLIKENESFKALNDEWKAKYEKQKEDYEKKIETINESHNQQIRALVSGRSENLDDETRKKLQEKKELSFEEQLLKDTRKELGLKEEN